MGDAIFCIVGAMVGAGFASGREIMQFFSLYGPFSWALVVLAAGMTGAVIYRMAQCAGTPLDGKTWARLPLKLMYLAVAGGMTAAAGELAALTVPLPRARAVGGMLTLAACAWMSNRPLRGLAALGKALFPGLVLIYALCRGQAAEEAAKPALSWREYAAAAVRAAGYCVTNGLLSFAVVSEAAAKRTRRERIVLAALSAAAVGLLLAVGNAVLLPRAGELQNAALPTVMLLRPLGKTGYWAAAGILYLACATTLIAVLKGLKQEIAPYAPDCALWIAALAAAGVSLLGFQEIVARAYPALGYLALPLLISIK